MMKQYLQIKEQNQDAILFFRLGDFYEMFGDDARKASKELDLTLTTRDKDKNKPFEEKVPMCGIPYHASDAYIARLIAKGYKVAICEQTQDPATAKGLVRPAWRRDAPTSARGCIWTTPARASACATSPPARPTSPPSRVRTGRSTCSTSWAGFPRRRRW